MWVPQEFDLYKNIVDVVKEKYDNKTTPPKLYISRRTWLHNDFSNIGTKIKAVCWAII